MMGLCPFWGTKAGGLFTVTLELKKKENIYNNNQQTSVKTGPKCKNTKSRMCFDKNKNTCKECLPEDNSFKYSPSHISISNITTHAKKIHEAKIVSIVIEF